MPDRDRTTRAVEVFIGIAMTGSLILAGIGGVTATRNVPGNAQPWFAWAVVVFGLAAFGAIFYFVLHPGFMALDAYRVRKVAEARNRRAAALRLSPSAASPVVVVGSQVLTIVAAVYGAEPTWMEVAETIRGAVVDDRLSLLVSNDTFGRDPVLNTPKTLRVSYSVNGVVVEQDAEFQEGTVAQLP